MNELEEIWDYLPVDDPTDDRSELASELSAEEAAVQIASPAEWQRPFDDPARKDVATADQDQIALAMADDEDDGRPDRDADRELDVADLLQRQHYGDSS